MPVRAMPEPEVVEWMLGPKRWRAFQFTVPVGTGDEFSYDFVWKLAGERERVPEVRINGQLAEVKIL